MRLTFALIVFAWASDILAQEPSGYIETNVGVSYTNAEVDYFPGISLFSTDEECFCRIHRSGMPRLDLLLRA